MSEDSQTSRLTAELAAARRVVDVLVGRIERIEAKSTPEDQLAMLKTMHLLENTVENRTRELRLSEARYRALYDHSPDVLLTVGAGGSVTAWNQTAARVFGDERLNTSKLEELFDPDVRRRVASWRRRGFPEEGTLELPVTSGQWFSLNAAGIPGQSGATQVVLHDVSARRSLERELDHANRLAAIGHLAAGVAHEINNPLAVIQFRLELFEQQLRKGPFDVEAASTQVGVLREHVLRIARIVKNLQTFAVPRTAERAPVAVAVLQAAVAELTAESRGAAQLVLFEDPPGLHVLVDRGAAEQVLVNLVTNAAQAMNRTGTIRVVAWNAGQDRVGLAVEDDGPGIAPELRDHVFTPFVTNKNASGGLGLGLSIAFRIVEDHGGVLRTVSLPSGGTRFELSFPRAMSATEIADEEPSIPHTRPLSLLVVDDEPSLASLLSHFAESAGHQVTCAGSAEQALKELDNGQYDAVITDLRLPGMSGTQLAREIAMRWPSLSEKIVFISGLFHSALPGQRYLQKPFSQRQLVALLHDLAR